jgi:S-adenosylmethionine/arginine decarboxylase-like enzyme
MIWIHIIADLKKINFRKLELTENTLKTFISTSLKEVWLTELWNHYHTFTNPDEITWVIALAESHITFHTWPEKDYISLDIFVCNIENNNSNKAKALYQEFIAFVHPWEIEEQIIERRS